jgi:hypothetical protein
LGIEARQCVEFTGVELADGTELAAPVKKATAGPVEKVAAGLCAEEARWRGRKTGCRALARRRCRLAERRRSGEGSAVESAIAEAARRRGAVVR